ncbi:Crp/Fnr family transcriptional regulator [Hyphobacterium sp. CCMP332]|nr:Crp/Fnr family transcriptional regulator [Hyphobacterium sp. CCMP332]
MTKDIDKIFKYSGFSEALIEEIKSVGRQKKVQAGQILIHQGSETKDVPFVISGNLRISRNDNDGHEMFLYYLEGGETCAMSITCCIEGKKSNFSAVAEEDSVLWMVPMQYLDDWLIKYPNFKKFIFKAYQLRFDELLNAIDSMVFMKMDQRLYKFLLDSKQASGSYQIHKTHEQIANELNTSRVVISRLLKQLEREGKIEQYRNRIEVL